MALEEAIKAWRGRLKIWGCIPSSLFNPGVSDEEFDGFMHDLFRIIAPGGDIILNIADNALPESSVERMRRVAEFVDQYGRCPIAA